MSNLSGKVEGAFATILTNAAIAGISVYEGLTYTERSIPCVACHFISANEEPLGTGNYNVTCAVAVSSTSDINTTTPDNPLTNHNANCESIFGVVSVDNLSALLSAAKLDFFVFGVVGFDYSQTTDDGRLLTTSMTVKIYCCEVDIT